MLDCQIGPQVTAGVTPASYDLDSAGMSGVGVIHDGAILPPFVRVHPWFNPSRRKGQTAEIAEMRGGCEPIVSASSAISAV